MPPGKNFLILQNYVQTRVYVWAFPLWTSKLRLRTDLKVIRSRIEWFSGFLYTSGFWEKCAGVIEIPNLVKT